MVAGRRLKVPSGFIRSTPSHFALLHTCIRAIGVMTANLRTVGRDATLTQQFGPPSLSWLSCRGFPARRCWISSAFTLPASLRGARSAAPATVPHQGRGCPGLIAEEITNKPRPLRCSRLPCPSKQSRAKIHQTVCDLGRLQIRPLHAIARGSNNNFGNATCRYARCYEMDRAHISRKLRLAFNPFSFLRCQGFTSGRVFFCGVCLRTDSAARTSAKRAIRRGSAPLHLGPRRLFGVCMFFGHQ